MIDIVQIASAAVAIVSPHLPALLKAGKFAGEKLIEAAAKKTADKALEKAGAVWDTLKGYFGEKPDLEAAANLLATNPKDPTYQKVLAKPLASLLKEKPELSEKLLALMGGEQRVQEVLAERASWVDDVTQELEGAGTQRVKAKDESIIRGVRQTAK
jgi:hypothetical protein